MTDKVRENLLRRMADRQGLKLTKTRRRDPRAIDYGGYMLVNKFTVKAVFGSEPYPYSASLEEIEDYLTRDPDDA